MDCRGLSRFIASFNAIHQSEGQLCQPSELQAERNFAAQAKADIEAPKLSGFQWCFDCFFCWIWVEQLKSGELQSFLQLMALLFIPIAMCHVDRGPRSEAEGFQRYATWRSKDYGHVRSKKDLDVAANLGSDLALCGRDPNRTQPRNVQYLQQIQHNEASLHSWT